MTDALLNQPPKGRFKNARPTREELEELSILLVRTDKIHANPWNPNKITRRTVEALGQNVGRVGFNQPILCRPHPEKDGELEIVDGEQRWLVARARKQEYVPVVLRDFTDAEAKAQTIAMNRLRGEMEQTDVAQLLADLAAGTDGISLDEFAEFGGYPEAEIEDMLRNLLAEGAAQAGGRAPNTDPESWVTLAYRVPESVGAIVTSELDRLKGLRETEHDHLALEVMAVNSAQTPSEFMEGV